jgi:hypothetical protein
MYATKIPRSSLLVCQNLDDLFTTPAVAPFLRSVVSTRRKVCVIIAVPATGCAIRRRLEPIDAEIVFVVIRRTAVIDHLWNANEIILKTKLTRNWFGKVLQIVKLFL